MIIDKATLLHTDCMEYMATLPDKAFDLAIVDPPYGIERFKKGSGGNRFSADARVRDKGMPWDIKPDSAYFDELSRISKNRIIWGGNYFGLPPTKGFVFWYKHQPVSNYAAGEYAWTSFDVPAKCFDYMYTNIVGRDAYQIHPTQKPVALYEWLLMNYAKPGQRILDTHLGSGSSAIACNNLGFEMIGCELDEDYYKAAYKRVQKATEQMRLFA